MPFEKFTVFDEIYVGEMEWYERMESFTENSPKNFFLQILAERICFAN